MNLLVAIAVILCIRGGVCNKCGTVYYNAALLQRKPPCEKCDGIIEVKGLRK